MELVFYGTGASNFGDDLNAIVWKNILPSNVFDVEDAALLGIGTIFTDQWTDSPRIRGKRVFVLGSGAGYGPLPRDMRSWTILALRGPLSAALIQQPQLAATDAAALLAVLPSVVTRAESRELVLLVPHHGSVPGANWKQVADAAGVTFVDPTWPLDVVLGYFAKAKLVLAEAMHAAIVADTLRIPWIPWVSSQYILPFKWVDWTMSLHMQYRPALLPPTSAWKKLRYGTVHVKPRHEDSEDRLPTMDIKEPSAYLADYHAQYDGAALLNRESKNPQRTALRNLTMNMSRLFDRGYIEPAADAVRRLTRRQPCLSDDHVFERRVSQLQDAVDRLVRILQQ
ncbi:MAG: hypothetical protein ABR956_19245 [Terracidiphilus sp.]|jgi:succinoglycan biosynthesis protein ExoV